MPLMLLALIGQLDHFGFAPVSSPQTVGVPCSLTIYAYDSGNNIYPFTGPAALFATPGPQYGNRQINFSSGVWQGDFTAYLADTYSIRCQDYSPTPHTGESNQIVFNPGAAYRLVLILPGQTYTPGIDSGKTGAPISQSAGASFTVAAYLTDRWCNQIAGRDDSLIATTTDVFTQPRYFRLVDGSLSYLFAFRTSLTHHFYLRDASQPAIKADTSTAIYAYPAAYCRPLVILPGETHLAGDTTSTVAATPGKTGQTATQFVNEDFTVRVFAVDSMWNKTGTSGNVIRLTSSFPFSNPSDQVLSGGETQFILHYTTIGDNQDLYAYDLTAGYNSYVNRVNIGAKTDSMDIRITPDTIAAGDTAHIRVTLYDLNGDVIPARLVTFAVHSGHGEIPTFYDSTFTDANGVGFSYFTSTSGYFNELDTIAVTADGSTFYGTCFIEFPDSMVMEGKIIAYPNPLGIRADHTRFIYYLQQNCEVIYAIYDPFGNMILRRNFSSGTDGARLGVNILTWDGRNEKGARVASGLYYVVIKGYVNTNVFLEKRIKVGVIW